MYLLINRKGGKTSKNFNQNYYIYYNFSYVIYYVIQRKIQITTHLFVAIILNFPFPFFLSNTSTSSIKFDKLTLNLFQVIGSSDPTCVFSGFRSTTPHPQLPSSICPFYRWTDIGPLHHPWDTCGGEPKSGPSLWSCWPGLELPCGSFRFWAGTKSWGKDQVIYQVIIT